MWWWISQFALSEVPNETYIGAEARTAEATQLVELTIRDVDAEYTNEYKSLRQKLINRHSLGASKGELCWLS
jgi:UDP-N-acetyl-D-mannosaminuronate dehydrogenase